MAKIAVLNDEYYINFDDHFLYHKGLKYKELSPRSMAVLAYLCDYPFCYKSIDNIKENLYDGWASDSTVRTAIKTLRDLDPIFREFVLTKPGAGYKYVGEKINDNETIMAPSEENIIVKNKSICDTNNVDVFASMLWKSRPFYQDDGLISTLFYRMNYSDSVGYDDTINSMIVELLRQSYSNGKAISLNKIPKNTTNQLIVVKESFFLEDVFCNGKHLQDLNTPYDLLEFDEERITMVFSGLNKSVETSMWLSGAKACMPMRHLVKILFESDRIFSFQVWGYFDRIRATKYNIKPLSVVYI